MPEEKVWLDNMGWGLSYGNNGQCYTRFQEYHERDFLVVDFYKKTGTLWTDWISDKRNADFRAHMEKVPTSANEKLMAHVMQPFKFMNEMVRDKEKWDMANANASIYQYNSLFGSGFAVSLVVLFIQVTIPN